MEETEFNGSPFTIAANINEVCLANTLLDTGCSTYGLISSRFVTKNNLAHIKIRPQSIRGWEGPSNAKITEMAWMSLDIGGNYQRRIYLYVVPKLDSHDIILGVPWMKHQNVAMLPDKSKIIFRQHQIEIPAGLGLARMSDIPKAQPISANAWNLWRLRARKDPAIQIFAVSLRDIEYALRPKPTVDLATKLPKYYHGFLDLFDKKKAETLPPHRPGIDHHIELTKDEKGKTYEPPWGPLYSMNRDELFLLRKTLNEYLAKGFIRVSNSPAAAPILFARKPGGGVRFCCDYRALNKITRKDRYPLPLIQETLDRISRAKWFTKLDVIAAFHRIRIAEGDEWMTAFRTRFGLFEWLVTPFGLANAPSTFQRYINWILREFLDEFVSAYIDDILVFSSGSLKEHREHVRKVLGRLQQAGLQVDINKCEFEVTSTKYLGFIIEAGKGIKMDPEKVNAILDWETPTSQKAVRAFLGFANFYRRFIKDFATVAASLTNLTKKQYEKEFNWTPEAQRAFDHLKKLFTTAPILTQFDSERETVVETDSSGWATGGVLSQYDSDGLLRPVAY